ncbi:tyrosine-type recombinase/integrase [Paenibacillus sp. OAS669]|uniref:tyrosine-type recombinase/integrase n=1 Tax=Paenibacillus sp. OAS669 TaxID=2663821 RepID=UPI00178B2858|nr:tyrosine-type recombinase/integrase [Paenibacillus sp. OAS669]MBE1446077.1 integrase/recombinase XerD [Paenibacillus sp. OAS669]
MILLQKFSEQLKKEGKSHNTIYSYHLAVKDFFSWFKGTFDKEPTVLYAQNVKDYVQFLQTVKNQGATTINAKIAALLKYNSFLISIGIQTDLVIFKNQRRKIQQKFASPAQFTTKDVNKFIQAVVEKGNARDYALVTLLTYTGCRISEALNIQINKDLHLSSNELVIRAGKGDKERTVLLNTKVVNAIKAYLKIRNEHKHADSPYLFVSNKAERMSRITANEIFTQYSEKAELDRKLTPHDLRHHFCSNALENGFNVHEVANIAGHSNIHTTLLYTNPTRQKMLDKLNRL